MTAFVDTAVIMYAGGSQHPLRDPCQRVVQRIVDGELEAVISAEVVQEIFHRFLAIRQPRLGIEMARAALDLFAPVLPISDAVMRRMPALVEQYPALAARDLVHVATCVEEGLDAIISPDAGFDQVRQLRRLDPAEIA